MKNNKTSKILIVSILSLNLVAFSLVGNVYADTQKCIALKNTLRVGSRDASTNSEVTLLQNFLHSQGYMAIGATGYFGNLTEAAVKNLQKKENILVIGQVGPLTRSLIKTISCGNSQPTQPAATVETTSPTTPEAIAPVIALKKLPYTSSNFLDWTSIWGSISLISDGILEMKASANTNGAQAILSNSSDWANYSLDVNIFVKQATVTLISRYVDENNFLGCTSSGRYLEIIQKVNGESSVVAFTSVLEAPYTQYFYNDLNLNMRVENKTVGCSIVGGTDNITFKNVDDKLLKGAVGVQIWASAPGIAGAELKKVRVKSI